MSDTAPADRAVVMARFSAHFDLLRRNALRVAIALVALVAAAFAWAWRACRPGEGDQIPL